MKQFKQSDRFRYGLGSLEDVRRIWEKDIAAHPDSPDWLRWQHEALTEVERGGYRTYLMWDEDEPVGQVTLVVGPWTPAVRGKRWKCDGETRGYVSALRIESQYHEQGHATRLMEVLERDAKALGFQTLCIGVEETERRNQAIYQHWGYTHPVQSATEMGAVVHYIVKRLT